MKEEGKRKKDEGGRKKVVVIHSGGMDSSICLALKVREFGKNQVVSLTFEYDQRHAVEVEAAKKISGHFGVEHVVIPFHGLKALTSNALIDPDLPIQEQEDQPPNTLVIGRNGLMARLGAIYAHQRGASQIVMGVIAVEGSNSGYRDCSRHYMDLMQTILRIDLDNPHFSIATPVVHMSKKETLEVANELGILNFLLTHTISCYEGLPLLGCQKCPACHLRNEGIRQFHQEHKEVLLPF
jgi:7-cyano-7-deazaguanine synthase